MSSVQSLPSALMKQYLNRPRETFVQTWKRSDFAARLEMLEEAKKPPIPPSLQPPFPTIIEARQALEAKRRRAMLRDDFAERITTIRERLERFSLNPERDEAAAVHTVGPQQFKRWDVAEPYSIRPRRAILILEEIVAADKASHNQPNDKPVTGVSNRSASRSTRPVLADPTLEKSGIQYFTGTQLDVIV